ncbi:MAG: discoidin domain-containing protein [Acutalibacter sp.]
MPPPSKVGAPKRIGLDEIAVYRPVFCSSESPEHLAKSVTDGEGSTSWLPGSQESGQWVMVDLEGSKDFAEIHLSFTQMVQEEFIVSLSDDREHFRQIFSSGARPETTDFVLSGLGERARFIRLSFPGKAYPVRAIGIYV